MRLQVVEGDVNSDPYVVTIYFDSQAPTQNLVGDITLSADGTTLSGQLSDRLDSTTRLYLSIDGAQQPQTVTVGSDGSWNYALPATLTPGDTYTVELTLRDFAGNTGQPIKQDITMPQAGNALPPTGQSGTDGDDTLSDGGHAGVTLNGGDGDDLFQLSRADTAIHGDSGFDRLFVTGHDLSLNLDKVTGVEQIDLGAGGANTLAVSLQNLLDIPDATPKTLMVMGDASDTVKLSAADGLLHAAGDVEVRDGVTFDVYHASAAGMDVATLLLEQSIQAQTV
jgi:hypothetical protein